MIRIIAVFAVITALIHFSIVSWRALSGKEKLGLTKSIGYSILVSLLAMLAMIGIYETF